MELTDENFVKEHTGDFHEAHAAGKKKPLKRKKSSDIAAVEDELKSILGTKVQLKMSGTKGKLEIQCFNREELERIVELLRSLA